MSNTQEFMYKYNEDNSINELKAYVDKTYGEHYAQNQFQATEFIIDGGHGEGFCIGNILKYAQRYGKKEGKNRKDLLKVLHYALIALHVHDRYKDIDTELRDWKYDGVGNKVSKVTGQPIYWQDDPNPQYTLNFKESHTKDYIQLALEKSRAALDKRKAQTSNYISLTDEEQEEEYSRSLPVG